jgi:cystathionine beta-lyase/cystathionine gamma-synthase
MADDGRGAGQGPSTRAVHAGARRGAVGTPISAEIVQSTTFVSDPAGRSEVLYSRYGNNPNHRRLEEKIRSLEGAEACVVTGSGMGAMAAALLACLGAGDHVLAAEALYGGTRLLLDRELSRLGIRISYANLAGEAWREALRPETRVILAEIPANPLLRVYDPAPLAEAGRERGAVVIIDVTFATPINFRGLEHGAGLVVHSATKYLGGHSDVTAGAVCGAAELIDRVRDRVQLFGTAPDPHAAWLVERGVKTLALRMERHNRNGLEVARWLSTRPEVARVHYPGLASHPDHAVATRLLDGFGGMLGVELVGGEEAASRFVRALRLAAIAPSLGGVETLVSEPRFTSHSKIPAAEREALGIRDGFVRFSVGIEDAEDIIADLAQALESLPGVPAPHGGNAAPAA